MENYDNELKELLNGRKLADMSADEMRAVQERKCETDVKELQSYLSEGKITRFDYEYLLPYYQNSMAVSQELFASVCRIYKQIPRIYYKNLDNGEVDRDNLYLIHHIAPFTSMVLEFHDDKGRPFEVSLGKIKSLKRVIEKISPNSTYALRYQENINRVIAAYGGRIDNPRCQQQLAAVPRPVENVKDIFRSLTICNRFRDVRNTFELMAKDSYVTVNPADIKDKHKGNILPHERRERWTFSDNPRNHRDFKFIAKLPGGYNAEFMAMTATYEKYYKQTHADYEAYRSLEQEIRSFPKLEDMSREQYLAKKRKELQLFQLKSNIRKVSGRGFVEENIEVLKDVRIMEDRLNYAGRRPQADGTFAECRDYIRDNFYVRTVQALDSKTYDYLSDPLYDVYERYLPEIRAKYLADIRDVENRYGMKGREGAYLDAHYLSADKDEYEILKAMDDGHVDLPRLGRPRRRKPSVPVAYRTLPPRKAVAKDNKIVAKSNVDSNMILYLHSHKTISC